MPHPFSEFGSERKHLRLLWRASIRIGGFRDKEEYKQGFAQALVDEDAE